MANFSFDSAARTPWNNVIYPGNYVTELNAYRDQGVVALPGAVFFKGVGALVLNPDNDAKTDGAGLLTAGTYALQVLSPDLRQDDKPRKDRPFTIPKGAVVYRTGVNAPGVREATVSGSTALTIAGISTPTAVPNTAGADGYFSAVGEFSLFESILDGTALASDSAVSITVSKDVIASTADSNKTSPSAIIVEVCYFMPDAVADADSIHIPYAVEAGQGY